jgi:magnesium chelatase family protein
MVARAATVAFQGIDVGSVDVQVQIAPGLPAFRIVGLPDKAVAESRERVRAALVGIGLSLPGRRILVNLAPADSLKEGSHYDLPVALALLAAMEVLPAPALAGYTALGELALDGTVAPVAGVLPAAVHAAARGHGLICPAASAAEAAWAGDLEVLAVPSLLAFVKHLRGTQALPLPDRVPEIAGQSILPPLDLADVKGQETAKRALEVAAAGGHNLLMRGPPGSGKSMLAARLPDLLPPMDPAETLESSMIQSVAGLLAEGRLSRRRPFRDPHHSASPAAMVGGGARARPGEISLAHNGVLFLDELPEFPRAVLEALRQPLETGRVTVARAAGHVTYPARFQLIAAMNPCRCGWRDGPGPGCGRAPACGESYQARLSGPLLDRIDLHVEVPAVAAADLALPPPAEGSAAVAGRVAAARAAQRDRYAGTPGVRTNAGADGAALDRVAAPDGPGRTLLAEATDRLRLSARAYHRVLRVARTLADLDGADAVRRPHVAEALGYRRAG